MDGTLVAHADDSDVDAFVGTGDGPIGLGAESHSSDRDARGANHARFDELSPVVVVRVHRVLLAFVELKKLAACMRPSSLFRYRKQSMSHITNT